MHVQEYVMCILYDVYGQVVCHMTMHGAYVVQLTWQWGEYIGTVG